MESQSQLLSREASIGQQAVLSLKQGVPRYKAQHGQWVDRRFASWTPGQHPTAPNWTQVSPTFYWTAATANASVSMTATLTFPSRWLHHGTVVPSDDSPFLICSKHSTEQCANRDVGGADRGDLGGCNPTLVQNSA